MVVTISALNSTKCMHARSGLLLGLGAYGAGKVAINVAATILVMTASRILIALNMNEPVRVSQGGDDICFSYSTQMHARKIRIAFGTLEHTSADGKWHHVALPFK